jgi:hypothetical protein
MCATRCPPFEDPAFDRIRRSLDASDMRWQFTPESLDNCRPPFAGATAERTAADYGENFNPLLRCIVRRTRAYLEATINPATGGYFLPKVTVKLFGEDERGRAGPGQLPARCLSGGGGVFQLAPAAGERCRILQDAAFAPLGSSMEAGRRTVSQTAGRRARYPG